MIPTSPTSRRSRENEQNAKNLNAYRLRTTVIGMSPARCGACPLLKLCPMKKTPAGHYELKSADQARRLAARLAAIRAAIRDHLTPLLGTGWSVRFGQPHLAILTHI